MLFLHRHGTTLLALLGCLCLLGLSGVLLTLQPTSSASVTPLGDGLPATVVSAHGTPVTYFPPPPHVTPLVVPTTAVEPAVITETQHPRAPYTPPQHPSLQVELSIPISEIAQLKPEWSEHRVYQPGEAVLVGATDDSRALARLYLDAVNQLRQEQNLPPLRWDADLAARAEGYASTQLYYYLLDGGRRVSGPREEAIARYFGLQRDDVPPIWFDAHPMPTKLLTTAPDTDAILESLRGSGTGPAPYGAAHLPVTRLGVGIALAQNGKALIPHGWLVMLFQ